jgi:putative ABC transport system permease protein
MSYIVTERTREIAIRMAVGADRKSVLVRILRKSLALTALGILAGLLVSAEVIHVASSLLFGVKPFDVLAITGAVGTLLLCSIIAAWIPARRAALVEPIKLLRFE